ncbi:hypothetical protein PISMIDRAFT_448669 [Pisolithus microcarpus 441]|uniref:Uncharacterized protein n=1 Tax=Pisolithus microcarpus 441 TaxID=765257 RepID=A0A0C9Z3D7_9AGAM|nr:hypothetical protein PISMIDRAFT_448669 [Pisolithus microcarpus 441]
MQHPPVDNSKPHLIGKGKPNTGKNHSARCINKTWTHNNVVAHCPLKTPNTPSDLYCPLANKSSGACAQHTTLVFLGLQ